MSNNKTDSDLGDINPVICGDFFPFSAYSINLMGDLYSRQSKKSISVLLYDPIQDGIIINTDNKIIYLNEGKLEEINQMCMREMMPYIIFNKYGIKTKVDSSWQDIYKSENPLIITYICHFEYIMNNVNHLVIIMKFKDLKYMSYPELNNNTSNIKLLKNKLLNDTLSEQHFETTDLNNITHMKITIQDHKLDNIIDFYLYHLLLIGHFNELNKFTIQ